MQSLLVSTTRQPCGLRFRSVTGQMPYYHKVVLDPAVDIQYHLAGYGIYYEEALIRYVGEGIERYSSISSYYALRSRVRYATHNQLKRDGPIVPLEYLSIFSDGDCQKLGAGKRRPLRKLGPDDYVGWLRCPSLIDPGNEIWVPVQMLFMGYPINAERRETAFLPSFSTGTAAHTSLEKALLNALLEVIQIDALMVHWYTRTTVPSIVVDNLTLLRLLDGLSDFDMLVSDLSSIAAVKVQVFGTALLNKKNSRPLIVYGSHADLDPVRALYRSVMEAAAITFLGLYGPLFSPKQYFPSREKLNFTDLDTNVGFFADPNEATEKRAAIQAMVANARPLSTLQSYESGDEVRDLGRLIKEVSKLSQFAVFLDVTPPEVREQGWYVMRVLVPELITMCIPGIPYSQHPRFAAFGGIRNQLPHPLP
jgi:thiazole/oxazole-forming peptide maturase SagD family component